MIEIVACQTPEELLPAFAPVFHYFGMNPGVQDGTRFVPFIGPSRAFAAREDGAVVGGCGSFPFELTVPGGSVRAAGLSVVGVMPTHRRRGILRRMMRAQLDDTHAKQEPLAILWASEDTIYGQFGYGMASYACNFDLPKSATAYLHPLERRGEFRMVGEGEAFAPLAQVYDEVRRGQPGMFVRSEEWWKHRRLADPENRRMGGGVLNRVLLTLDGRPAGYALYRIHQHFEAGVTQGYVNVIEAMGTSLQATREIWRMLMDIDWVQRIKAMILPVDHPLLLMVARPRELGWRLHDGLWVRLVDLPAALAARRLADGPPVVLEVADAFCPWNAGRWRIGPEGATRTNAAADLACDVTVLGAVYLGGFTFVRMVRAGRAAEVTDGAARRADALFPADRAPWCPEIF